MLCDSLRTTVYIYRVPASIFPNSSLNDAETFHLYPLGQYDVYQAHTNIYRIHNMNICRRDKSQPGIYWSYRFFCCTDFCTFCTRRIVLWENALDLYRHRLCIYIPYSWFWCYAYQMASNRDNTFCFSNSEVYRLC